MIPVYSNTGNLVYVYLGSQIVWHASTDDPADAPFPLTDPAFIDPNASDFEILIPVDQDSIGTLASQDANAVQISGGSAQLTSIFKVNRGTRGSGDLAAAGGVLANSSAGFKVNGFLSPSEVALRPDRDSVAFYLENTAIAPPRELPISSYNASGCTFSSAQSSLQTGTFIDTLHTPKYTGKIVSISGDNTAVSVDGWFQQGDTSVGQVPPNGVNAIYNPTTKIFGQNTALYLSSGGYSRSAAGYEIDLYNSVGQPSDEYGDGNDFFATNPTLWGIDVVNQGTFGSSIAYNQRKEFFVGFKSSDCRTAGFLVEEGNTRNPGFGFLSRQTANSPFGHLYDGTDLRFRVTNVGSMNLGSQSTVLPSFIDFHNGFPVRSARIIATGGTATPEQGLLQLRAADVEVVGDLNITGNITAGGGLGGGGGSGTVTSVGLSAPSEFTVTGSPVTSSGDLTLDWSTQTAGDFLVANGLGVPEFRAIATGDLPAEVVTDAELTSALGDYTLSVNLATVATSGDYSDLSNLPLRAQVVDTKFSGIAIGTANTLMGQVSVTPRSINSKFLVLASGETVVIPSGGSTITLTTYNLERTAPSSQGLLGRSHGHNHQASGVPPIERTPWAISSVDAPATISPVTYRLVANRFNTAASSWSCNNGQIVVVEIL